MAGPSWQCGESLRCFGKFASAADLGKAGLAPRLEMRISVHRYHRIFRLMQLWFSVGTNMTIRVKIKDESGDKMT